MSIHNDPRRFSTDDEYREWQNDLRMEYARETYEEKHPYDDDTSNITCAYWSEDGSCNCDDHCKYQKGKWKDICGLNVEDKEDFDAEN